MTAPTPDLALEDLYREILLDHYRSPRNHGQVAGPVTNTADGANPLCGDQLTVELNVADGKITEIAIDGQGCSISQASASMMSVFVSDRGTTEALAAVATFQRMMLDGETPPEEFGDIEALAGVAKFPVRVKCASLGWKTLEQALAGGGSVSTDDRSTSDD